MAVAARSTVAAATGHLARDIEIVWCSSNAQLEVLARSGSVDLVLLDGRDANIDLVVRIAQRSLLLIADDPAHEDRWVRRGAAAVLALPIDGAELRRILDRLTGPSGPTAAKATDRAIAVDSAEQVRTRGRLLAITGGIGADVPTAAVALARSLGSASLNTKVVVADLLLSAPLGSLHGLEADAPGLFDLLDSSHHRPPPAHLVDGFLHADTLGRYRLLPGLRGHSDWIRLGPGSLRTAMSSLRDTCDLLIAPVDDDLEGEEDTGSFDIDDRNRLARTTTQGADLIVLVTAPGPTGIAETIRLQGCLEAFGVAPGRMLVLLSPTSQPRRAVRAIAHALLVNGGMTDMVPVTSLRPPGIARRFVDPTTPRGIPRARRSLRRLIGSRLAAIPSEPQPIADPTSKPLRITPGSLGHWPQGDDGWITPRAPQQP